MSRRVGLDDAGGELLAEFARRLAAAIEGLTFREVARRSGLQVSTVSRLVQGTTAPDLLTVSKLERALNAELFPVDLAREQRVAAAGDDVG